ncbi:hypothetical protein [Nostoc sp.]
MNENIKFNWSRQDSPTSTHLVGEEWRSGTGDWRLGRVFKTWVVV